MRRLLPALIAALLTFATAVIFWRAAGGDPSGHWAFPASLVVLPAGLLALFPLSGRIVGLIGGAMLLAAGWAIDTSGADNPAGLIPLSGACLLVASLAAEVCVRLVQRFPRAAKSTD